MHAPFTPITPNPLHIANEAQKMAEKAGHDGRVFQKVAMVSMGVMAAASVMQMLMPLLRELNRKYDHDDRERSRGR